MTLQVGLVGNQVCGGRRVKRHRLGRVRLPRDLFKVVEGENTF